MKDKFDCRRGAARIFDIKEPFRKAGVEHPVNDRFLPGKDYKEYWIERSKLTDEQLKIVSGFFKKEVKI